MQRKFFVSVSNSLLTPAHRKGIGSAIWEFMWCLDKMTSIDKADGVGLVLGKATIKLARVAEELGTCEVTASRNLNRLANAGYILIEHRTHGIGITIPRAKKRFNKKVNPQSYPQGVWTEGKNVKPPDINVKGSMRQIQYDNSVAEIDGSLVDNLFGAAYRGLLANTNAK